MRDSFIDPYILMISLKTSPDGSAESDAASGKPAVRPVLGHNVVGVSQVLGLFWGLFWGLFRGVSCVCACLFS